MSLKTFLAAPMPEAPPPLPAPERLEAPAVWPTSDALDDWKLLPTAPDWAGGFRETWTPGENGAEERVVLAGARAELGNGRFNSLFGNIQSHTQPL